MSHIKKKQELCTFRHTMLYKEIKVFSGQTPINKSTNRNWPLHYALINRENGLVGVFNSNQQRRIANLYIPNSKISCLVSLNSIICVCKFNRDGSKLITGSSDGIVRIYNASKGIYHLISRIKLQDYHGIPLDLDFSPCGNYFGYSTWSKSFYVVPVNGASQDWQCYPVNDNRFHSFTFSFRFSLSDNGRTMVSSTSSSVLLCDRTTRTVRSICTNENSTTNIHAISYVSDQDSNLIVSGCSDGLIKLWDLRCYSGERRTTKPVSVFIGHLGDITYIDPRNDGQYILSNSFDQTIRLWDLRRPTPSNKVRAFYNTLLNEWDFGRSTARRYNERTTLEGDVTVMTYRGHKVTKPLLRAKFSPIFQTGQRFIYTGCSTGRIIIYDVLTGNIKETIEGHRHVISDLDWHPQRSEIISASWDCHVNLNSYSHRFANKPLNSEVRVQGVRRSGRLYMRSGLLNNEYSDDDIE